MKRAPGGLKIGLLGGSFNPAHKGHRQISLEALKRLQLDQVWWLVSPQNPLKSNIGMAAYENRLAGAQAIARHPKIRASDFEQRHHTRFTIDTLARLPKVYPAHRFIWLMGADNLCQITAWRRWQQIFETVPVAVIDRPGHTYSALAGQAAQYFKTSRLAQPIALAATPAPAWCFLFTRRHTVSASEIRQNGA